MQDWEHMDYNVTLMQAVQGWTFKGQLQIPFVQGWTFKGALENLLHVIHDRSP